MRISVCMATYNGEKYIAAQLESILKQLSTDDEIIISDDSSNDMTIQIIKSFKDERIKLFEGQKFKNSIFNFENAIRLATNRIIFLSDQDDEWEDGKVRGMLKELETHDIVITDHSLINEDGRLLLTSYFAEVSSGPGILKNLKKNTYYGCCMAFNSKILKVALPFPKDIPMHDIWLGFVADLFFTAKFIDYPFTRYRKHSNNVSNASELVSKNSLGKKLKYRWNIVKYFPRACYRHYLKKTYQ